MAADIMQPQIAPVYGADQVDQFSDDVSIDILNLTPDKEGAQQHDSASPFAESTVQEEGGSRGDGEMQEVTPERQLLPPPQHPPPQILVQHKLDLELAGSRPSDATGQDGTAAAANGSPSVNLAADSSDDDEAPLVRMRSQDMAASAQRSGSAERTMQQQRQKQQSRAQNRLSPASSTEPSKKPASPAANGHGAAAAGKKRALEQGSGDSGSSSGDEDASGAPGKCAQSASQARKKRRNVLPVIRKDQRCGQCRTCLNPQMKKACLTRRAEMMKDMDKKGDLPLSLLATIGKQNTGSAVPRQASSSAPVAADSSSEEEEEADPWAKDVEALNLSRNGGLPGPKRVPLFLKVLHGADTRDKRLVALKILDLSRGEALDAFTHSTTGLKTLGEWVSDATAANEASVALAKHVLALLRKLPIDIDALRISGIAKLLKAAGKKCPVLQEPAKQLVEIWKKLVPSEPAPTAQKRPAAAASLNRQDSDSKKPKADPQKPPSAAAPPVAGKPAGADASKAPADSAQPASSQAAAGAGSKSLLVAGDFAELDTPPTVFKKAVPKFPSQPVKKIQVLEGVVPKPPAEGTIAPEASAAATDAAQAGSVTAPAASSAPHVTATGLPAQPKKTTVTVSIGAPSYNFGAEPTVGFTGSRLGGPPPENKDQRSAAERAAEAASKIPDPEPDPDAPKRVKRKSVSWANDSLLQSVRLFSLYEPCNKVGSGEAQAHEQVLPVSERAVHAVHPAGFENAARKEHHNEAAALRNIHEQGAPEPAQEAEVDDTDVSPELDWCQPPLCVLWEYSQDNPQLPIARLQPGDIYACGEASQERQEREAYRHLHPHLDFGPEGQGAPPCPEELPSAQQRPLPGQLPRRVLWDQAPALQPEPMLPPPQLQPQPQPYLPPPPAQQQPFQAASAPAPAINISSETLQQLLLSVSQNSGAAGQPGQQQGNGFQQQVPVQAMPQPQQQQQWNAPKLQPPPQRNPPPQQAPQQARVPKPVSLPAPGKNINPQHPRRQQAAPGASTRQPDQAQQRKPPVTLKPPVQPELAQPPVSKPPQQQRAPVVLKAPGQPNRGPPARPPGPVVLPRPAQPQYPPPPQAGQPRPAQPAPAFNQQPPRGVPQNPRPPPVQQAPRQGNGAQSPRPPVQLGPPGNAPRPQQGPRGQGRALCTYFNTPRGCRKGDRCEFVHERH